MHGHPRFPELGLLATIHKAIGKFIGPCGLLPWTIDGQEEVEVAYTIAREYWGHGLGTEAARAILNYGFEKLNLSRLICLIDAENIASKRWQKRLVCDMKKKGEIDWFVSNFSITVPAG